MPRYLVNSTVCLANFSSSSHTIKIVDFGESFLGHDIPDSFHTPLPVRAPEIVFGDKLNYRVDLWSMGCMLFELFVGQPPFDSFMTTPTILVRQMLEMASDELPKRWQPAWDVMNSVSPDDRSDYTLQGWLEEVYFDGERDQYFSREDILEVERALSSNILENLWLQKD
ncbi:hypothetical protein P153DRAFT_377938 [Dothidotthia symphoricarpi CBS 119687]|uniref:Protein kinase domain-containing protein n=1 Tax=Dothidotthia symphoricarpi CBS 119687 TaxID=1392245 RepID=A0A6A6A2T4_9PLEO|nr:uncharacterized protein P153DRAFT_377938 [Dothidotthia symphoricarpi CBS 119687]KAF2126322.1 hypothetical protein P153DRAFT_377938 [Dothidotthia symphoricarpi CBS 119687]